MICFFKVPLLSYYLLTMVLLFSFGTVPTSNAGPSVKVCMFFVLLKIWFMYSCHFWPSNYLLKMFLMTVIIKVCYCYRTMTITYKSGPYFMFWHISKSLIPQQNSCSLIVCKITKKIGHVGRVQWCYLMFEVISVDILL